MAPAPRSKLKLTLPQQAAIRAEAFEQTPTALEQVARDTTPHGLCDRRDLHRPLPHTRASARLVALDDTVVLRR
jgi:hypothetical protein